MADTMRQAIAEPSVDFTSPVLHQHWEYTLSIYRLPALYYTALFSPCSHDADIHGWRLGGLDAGRSLALVEPGEHCSGSSFLRAAASCTPHSPRCLLRSKASIGLAGALGASRGWTWVGVLVVGWFQLLPYLSRQDQEPRVWVQEGHQRPVGERTG